MTVACLKCRDRGTYKDAYGEFVFCNCEQGKEEKLDSIITTVKGRIYTIEKTLDRLKKDLDELNKTYDT
jgi:hypothetical protein